MDRRYASAPIEALQNAPVIPRSTEPGTANRTETFVPAAPSALLNAVIGAAWVFHLLSIFSYESSTLPVEAAPPLLFGFAVALNFILQGSMLGVIALAFGNSAKTAPLSFAVTVGTMIFGALCGLAGHPASAWLSDLAFGSVVAACSLAVFARRA